ncbi:MAG: NifU family protein [Pseudomonadota bacterium]
MIDVQESAKAYFKKLIDQQDEPAGLGLRLVVTAPGTPAASCELDFCVPGRAPADDQVVQLDGFDLYIDRASVPFLEEAEMAFEKDATGGQLVVKAPNLRGAEPGADSPLAERVQYVLDKDINPSVAAHGGRVDLVQVSEAGEVVLQFGGGCHGCGMVSVTLKEGVEKTLREQIPEVTSIRDVTDHSSGENPYY